MSTHLPFSSLLTLNNRPFKNTPSNSTQPLTFQHLCIILSYIMALRIASLLLFLSLHLSAFSQPPPCTRFCVYRFCKINGNPVRQPRRLLLRDAGVGTPPVVCTKQRFGPQLARVIRSGQALVGPPSVDPQNFVPISRWRPTGLSPRFKRTYFKISPIIFPTFPGKFGISREASLGNQEEFLDNLCVQVPLTKFVLFNGVDNSTRTVKSRKRTDCVAFLATRALILIELVWNSADDFDVTLMEPSGFVISRLQLRSPTKGKSLGDFPRTACSPLNTGREQIVYRTDSNPLKGEYKVEVRHFTNCQVGATSYNLAVIVNGTNVLNRSGLDDNDDDAVIVSENFTIT